MDQGRPSLTYDCSDDVVLGGTSINAMIYNRGNPLDCEAGRPRPTSWWVIKTEDGQIGYP